MLRKAFTLIELIFVITIVAILGVVMAPKLSNDDLQLATDQLIRHIRYTQHLALSEDMYLSEANQSKRYTDVQQQRKATQQWFKQWWQIQIHENLNAYSIYSDHPTNSAATQEFGNDPDYSATAVLSDRFAVDPQTGLFIAARMTNNAVPEAKRLAETELDERYNVSINMNNCNSMASNVNSSHILFDHLGRPHCGISTTSGLVATLNPFDYLLKAQIRITLTSNATNESKIVCIEPETGFAHECQ